MWLSRHVYNAAKTFALRRSFATASSLPNSFLNSEVDSLTQELVRNVGKNVVSVNETLRQQKSIDESHHRNGQVWIVVTPTVVEQVSTVLQICNARRAPVIPSGTCTGLEGGVTAPFGGVSIDTSALDQVLAVNAEDFDCTVQAGVTRKTLNSYLRDTGLWFPVDPGADASLGGMCATSASGTNAVRYGTMQHNVMNLQVVTPSGKIFWTRGTGRRAKKTAAGYNMTNLFVGSEGTLGVITAATLKLYGKPETVASAVCSFQSEKNAVEAVVQTLQSCVPVARIEFLDDVQMKACNDYSQLDYPVTPTLFLEFHGSQQDVNGQAESVGEICRSLGGSSFLWSKEESERNRLWQARHNAAYAALAIRPGSKAYCTDVCVPISNLAQTILDTKKDIVASGVIGPIVGHVGDGNFHCFMLIDPANDDEQRRVRQVADRLVKRALAVGGTCTGEHGVGVGKRKYLLEELGPDALDTMRTLKHAIDPNGIMNPGKVIPNTH